MLFRLERVQNITCFPYWRKGNFSTLFRALMENGGKTDTTHCLQAR